MRPALAGCPTRWETRNRLGNKLKIEPQAQGWRVPPLRPGRAGPSGAQARFRANLSTLRVRRTFQAEEWVDTEVERTRLAGAAVGVLSSALTPDAQHPGARRQMAEAADLLGAVRLPTGVPPARTR